MDYKKGAFDAINLAAYISKKYKNDFQGKEISKIKLQKSLYFCFAYWAGFVMKGRKRKGEVDTSLYNEILFNNRIEAWVYGPVIVDVYNCPNIAEHYDENMWEGKSVDKEYIDGILDDVLNVNDFRLVEISHMDNCWKRNYNSRSMFHNKEITKKEIIAEYEKKSDKIKLNMQKGRFSSNPVFKDLFFKDVDLNQALHSVNISDEKFTNFIKTKNDFQYTQLEEIYNCNDLSVILENKFESGTELLDNYSSDEYKLRRLFRIIKENTNIFIGLYNKHEIIKYKYRTNPSFQLYFRMKNGKITLVLVDIYHLAIPASHGKNTADEMLNKNYEENKRNSICISEITSII